MNSKKYLIYTALIALAVFSIVFACQKIELNKNNKIEPLFFTYDDFEFDTAYYFRIKVPNEDSTFLITAYLLSNTYIGLDVEKVVSEESDSSNNNLVFVNYDIDTSGSGYKFTVDEAGQKIWVIDLLGNQIVNWSEPNPWDCTIECYCSGDGDCWTYYNYDDVNRCHDFYCGPSHFYACNCECRARAIKGSTIVNAPFVVIQADELRFNGQTY